MSAAALSGPHRQLDAARHASSRSIARTAAGLALFQTVLFIVPMVVLGRAIGWPASLRLPAAEALPLIANQAEAVLIGYGAYLAVSLALIPLAFVLRGWLAMRGVSGWLVDTATFLGAGAGLFKTLGIVRWLSVMPLLAAEYGTADEPARRMIELSYRTMNAYAGAVGELLGVQLLSGLWLVAIGWALRRAGKNWLGLAGFACGALFLTTALRVAIPAAGMIQSAAVPLALAWFIGLAIMLWRDGRA
jgi:hypothetical protein